MSPLLGLGQHRETDGDGRKAEPFAPIFPSLPLHPSRGARQDRGRERRSLADSSSPRPQ